MVSRFLLLMALSVCVSGTLVVKVAHSSYQTEEDQDLTLEWTFTPKPDSSLKTLNIFCEMFNPQKDHVLLNLHKGVEVPQKDGDFKGRVQCDKEVLKEGRIRLHVSSLRTEDSGWYQCKVLTESGSSLDRCEVSVIKTLVVNVAQSYYQAEVDKDLTLEWTFTPKPDRSLKTLNIVCRMFENQKDLVLFHLHEGVEVPQKERDFVGRVRCDKEVLKEGRIRLHVSSLRIKDTGWYQCGVNTEYGNSVDRCYLRVSKRKDPLVGPILSAAALIGLICVCSFCFKCLLRLSRYIYHSYQNNRPPQSIRVQPEGLSPPNQGSHIRRRERN